MVDPDASYPSNPTKAQYLHWLQPNTKLVHGAHSALGSFPFVLTTAANTSPVLDYQEPMPPTNSSAHRYIVYLYQQPSNFAIPPAFAGYGIHNRSNFNIEAFAAASNLGLPLAANYFYVSNSTNGISKNATGPVVTQTTGYKTREPASTNGSSTPLATKSQFNFKNASRTAVSMSKPTHKSVFNATVTKSASNFNVYSHHQSGGYATGKGKPTEAPHPLGGRPTGAPISESRFSVYSHQQMSEHATAKGMPTEAPRFTEVSYAAKPTEIGRPAEAPQSPPIGKPVQAPESPPIGRPVQAPESPQVGRPAQAPESPPVGRPAQAPESPPVGRPVQAPASPPAAGGWSSQGGRGGGGPPQGGSGFPGSGSWAAKQW